jgi:hypothetical protein
MPGFKAGSSLCTTEFFATFAGVTWTEELQQFVQSMIPRLDKKTRALSRHKARVSRKMPAEK